MAGYLLIPVAFVLLVPLLLVFAFGFYVLTLFHGVRAMLAFLLGKHSSYKPTLQKPHFLESPVVATLQSEDESNPAT